MARVQDPGAPGCNGPERRAEHDERHLVEQEQLQHHHGDEGAMASTAPLWSRLSRGAELTRVGGPEEDRYIEKQNRQYESNVTRRQYEPKEESMSATICAVEQIDAARRSARRRSVAE